MAIFSNAALWAKNVHLDKGKQFIDIATEFVTVFLDKHEQTLDEKDL